MSIKPRGRAGLVAELTGALRESSGLGVLYSEAVARRLGINSTDLESLDVILSRGPLSAGELAQACGVTAGAITGVLDRLEAAGFAARQADASDRRRVLVRAAPGVEQRLAPLFAPMARAVGEALKSYDEDELALVRDFVDRTRTAAGEALREIQSRGG